MWVLPILTSTLLYSPQAPVPKHIPDYYVELSVNEAIGTPFEDGYFTLSIRNNTAEDLEIRSIHFIDLNELMRCVIRNENNEDVTKERLQIYRKATVRGKHLATIPSGITLTVPIESSVANTSDLIPGSYKCKAIFEYRELTLKSNELSFVITQKQIDAYLAKPKE